MDDPEYQRLLQVVERITRESGSPQGFDADAWLTGWMREPNPALGNEAPLNVVSRPGGLDLVRNLLLRMQSGAYS